MISESKSTSEPALPPTSSPSFKSLSQKTRSDVQITSQVFVITHIDSPTLKVESITQLRPAG